MEIFEKYKFNIINNIDLLETTKNISYFRSRAFKINKCVQDKLIINKKFIEYTCECNNKMYTYKYYVGQQILCKNTFKRKFAKCFYKL